MIPESNKPWAALGISEMECDSVFGFVGSAGTLDDRSKAIDTIIQRKLGEM
jgi:hypothetical protein